MEKPDCALIQGSKTTSPLRDRQANMNFLIGYLKRTYLKRIGFIHRMCNLNVNRRKVLINSLKHIIKKNRGGCVVLKNVTVM